MPSDPPPAAASPPREATDPTQLAADLEREKEEVLRLRNLLIARDAELGAALGRLAELEDRSKRLLGKIRRIAGSFRGSPS